MHPIIILRIPFDKQLIFSRMIGLQMENCSIVVKYLYKSPQPTPVKIKLMIAMLCCCVKTDGNSHIHCTLTVQYVMRVKNFTMQFKYN